MKNTTFRFLLFFFWGSSGFVFCQNINRIEYFIDTDPGYGVATNVPITAAPTVTANFNVPISSVSDGFHFLSIRGRDVNNIWSLTGIRSFYKETIPNTTLPSIITLEYFIDSDPGFGLANAISINSSSNLNSTFTIPLNSISDGFHFISIRAKDSNNKWSMVGIRPFYKETLPNAILPNIIAMEYFIDTDPGLGAGTSVNFTATNPTSQSFTVGLGSLTNGSHQLSIRAKDANNKWSIVGIKNFTVQDNIIVIGTTPPTWCTNAAFNIPFTVTGTYNTGNIFTAQLSNSNGSFTSPITLGTLVATGGGTIVATIPNTVSIGTGYQVRIISSTPSVVNSPTKAIQVGLCSSPCASSITLTSPADDVSTQTIIKEANATTGTIIATNKITGNANVIYQAQSITLNPGFKADNGSVFISKVGGCN